MRKGRLTLLFFGLSPRAPLPSPMIIMSFAFAVVLFCISCTSGKSVSPDIPAGVYSFSSGRDILATSVGLQIRPPQGGDTPTRANDWYLIRRLDLFVFNDDEIGALDAYTRSYAYSPSSVTVHSASGGKRLVAIANYAFPDDVATRVFCYEDLCRTVVDFTDDHPSFPVMSGESRFVAGEDEAPGLLLEPLMSTVEIRALRCRMDDGRTLRDVRVYLTGVCNRAEVLRQEGFLPAETLNNGGLSETDLGRLAYSGMVYKYLGNGRDGGNYGSAVLYCYPNEAEDESVASPYTRLVVEGVLDGRTCYYPIPINRGAGAGEPGVGRNCRYVFDLTLTRPGTDHLLDDVLPPP